MKSVAGCFHQVPRRLVSMLDGAHWVRESISRDNHGYNNVGVAGQVNNTLLYSIGSSRDTRKHLIGRTCTQKQDKRVRQRHVPLFRHTYVDSTRVWFWSRSYHIESCCRRTARYSVIPTDWASAMEKRKENVRAGVKFIIGPPCTATAKRQKASWHKKHINCFAFVPKTNQLDLYTFSPFWCVQLGI